MVVMQSVMMNTQAHCTSKANGQRRNVSTKGISLTLLHVGVTVVLAQQTQTPRSHGMNKLIARLATAVLFSATLITTAQAPAKAAKPVAPAATKAAPAKTGEPLDLNTATPDQLKALPGIGDAYAKRIIDGRPYTMKNQLTQRGIIPQATYDKIKDQIVAHRPAKK